MANDLNKGSVTYAENRRDFLESLKSFHASQGTPFDRTPKIDGRAIDLYKLYKRVTDLGGWKKVNQLMLWDNLLEEFNIPEACSNGQQILQVVYIRYLKLYEKVKFWGQDPDDDVSDSTNGHSRKKVSLPLESIPLFYNYSQHQVSAAERKANKLSKDLIQFGNYEKLELSLRSGLANEVDFALNVCLLLSAQDKEFLRLNQTRHLLSLLMATVGVFEQGPASMQEVMMYNWNSGECKRDYAQFWLDVVKDEQIRESLKTDAAPDTEGEKVGSEVLSGSRELSAKDTEGQRATQVAMLIRNLSIEDANQRLLSSNHLVVRFLMLCVHSSYGSLHHLALDALGNLAVQMVLEPMANPSTQLVMSLIQKSIMKDDKFDMIRALEILSNLCKVEDNDVVLNKGLEEGTYSRIVQLLMVYDVYVIIQSLEALYHLSALGESTATKIAHVRSAVDILVSMVTVDIQSYGPNAQRTIQVVEYVAADKEDASARCSSPQPASYFMETATPCVQSPEKPSPPPAETVTVKSTSKNVTPEVEILVSKWLNSTYEINAGSTVPHTELYADYQEMCRKRRITRLLSVPDLINIAKTVFPDVSEGEVDKGGGGKETVFKELRKCLQPKPFSVITTKSGSSMCESIAVGVSTTQTCKIQPLILPASSLQFMQAVSSATTVVCHAATATCHTVTATCHAATATCHAATATCHAATSTCHAATATCFATTTTCHSAAIASQAASVACQTAFPTRMVQPADQIPGRTISNFQPSSVRSFSSQTVRTVSTSSPQAVTSRLQNHQQTTSLQQVQLVGVSNKFVAGHQQTQRGKVPSSPACVLTSQSLSTCSGTRTSSPMVSVGTSATVSSSSDTSSTWITIPCGPQVSWAKQQTGQKGGKKVVSKGLQAAESEAIKTLLAKKVGQQKEGQGSPATTPSPHLQLTHNSLPVPSVSTSTLQHPQLVPKLQYPQSYTPDQLQVQQQQQQTQLATNQQSQVFLTNQPGSNQVHITHTQQAPQNQADQQNVAWNVPQTIQLRGQSPTMFVRQASAVPVQQSVTPQPQLVQSQTQQTVQLQQQQQPVAVEGSLQTTQTPTQSSQQETVLQQQLSEVQNNQQAPQASPQISVVPQSHQSALLRRLVTASPPVLVRQGQTGLTLPQQSAAPVQGQQHPVQMGQTQVLQVQPQVQQVLQVQGQQLVLQQQLLQQPRQQIQFHFRGQGQPQTISLPSGQIMLRANQPVQVRPHQRIIVQQGQPRQVIIQGSSGLQQILPQPVQQLQVQSQLQGQGQAVRIQQPMVVQLPGNQWPQMVASPAVNGSTTSQQATSMGTLGAGSSVQGVSTPYRAIVPRPSSNPPAQFCQQAPDPTSGPGARQLMPDGKGNVECVKSGATQTSGHMGLSAAESIGGAGSVVHSVGVGHPVNNVHGTSAEGMAQIAATCVQTFAPSTLSVSRGVGMSVGQSSVSSCLSTVSMTMSPAPTALSSQHTPIIQSSFKTIVPSIPNVCKSESSAPLSQTLSSGCTAKYNGRVNGTILHKEGICNGTHSDLTADPSVGKGKVNGVLSASKSDRPVGSCPMSLNMKKEFVNGVGERCVPLLPDSLTGCSKEWLNNLQVSLDGDGLSSRNPVKVDISPPHRETVSVGSGQDCKTFQKTGVWQRNGLIAHAGVSETSNSVRAFDQQHPVYQQDSLSEHSMDSVDSSHSGSQPLLSSASTQAGGANGDLQGVPKNYFFRTRKRSRSFRQLHEGVQSSSSSESESESADGPSASELAKQLMKKKLVPRPQKESPPVKKKKVCPPSRPGLSMPKEIVYLCEWSKCGRVFNSAGKVLAHAAKVHAPYSPEFVCQWQGCQPLKRKRWSLVTHLQDHHCTEAKQRAASERRYLTSHKAILPQPPQAPVMVYPEDAAQQAIQRFQRQPPFVEFTQEGKECPLTKHIRLTSALTLRNLARNSSFGRRLIRRKEAELSYIAMSEVEASSALAKCLWELIQDM